MHHHLSWDLYSSEEKLNRSSCWPIASVQISDTAIIVSSHGIRYSITSDQIIAIDWRRCILAEIRVKFSMEGQYNRLRLHCLRLGGILNSFELAGYSEYLKHDPDFPIFWGHED